MTGYFRMHRGWQEHHIFVGDEFSRRDAWAWLIESACWKDTPISINGKTVVLKRGQMSYSVRFLASKWGWEKARVERFIARLKTETMVRTATETGQMVITICNYEKYQSDNMHTETATETLTETVARQQRDKEEGSKEVKKEEVGAASSDASAPTPSPKPRKPRANTKTRLDPLFIPPDEWGEYAVGKGFSIEETETMWSRFKRHHLAKGSVFLDWLSAWQTWVLRELDYRQRDQQRRF